TCSAEVVDADADGVVTYSGALGGWTLNIDTGLTKPASGTAAKPNMDLGWINQAGAGAGTLTIEFTGDGFTGPYGFLQTVGGTITGSGMTDSFESFYGAALYAKTTSLGSIGPFSAAHFSGAQSHPAGVALTPYALTMVITLTPGSGGITSGNYN